MSEISDKEIDAVARDIAAMIFQFLSEPNASKDLTSISQ